MAHLNSLKYIIGIQSRTLKYFGATKKKNYRFLLGGINSIDKTRKMSQNSALQKAKLHKMQFQNFSNFNLLMQLCNHRQKYSKKYPRFPASILIKHKL